MRNLTEDLDEMDDDRGRRWVRKARRAAGLLPAEGSCWLVVTEGGSIARGPDPEHTVDLGHSPADMLDSAEMRAGGGRRIGLAHWITEVYGDGESLPDRLRVRAVDDEAWFKANPAEGES